MPPDRAAIDPGSESSEPAAKTRPVSLDQNVFATLAAGRKNWAVASIYGEAERLVRLHAELGRHITPEDNLIYLGNFLGRGHDVATTVQELLLFRRALMARQIDGAAGEIVYLRGSQEEMWHKLLQLQFAPNPRHVLEWMLTQGIGATLEAYGGSVVEGRSAAARGAVALSQWANRLRAAMRAADGHERLMSALRRAAYTQDGALLFVNAGIDPTRSLSQQTDSFWWGGRDFDAIEGPYAGFKRLIRGADLHRRGVMIRDGTASIDGGCGFGGPLIAACFGSNGELIETIEA